MSTNTGETRFRRIINYLKKLFNIVSEETKETIKTSFQGAHTYTLPLHKEQSINTFSLPLDYQEKLELKELKPIYVLIKNLFAKQEEPEIIISQLSKEFQEEISVKTCHQLGVVAPVKAIEPESYTTEISHFDGFVIKGNFGSAKDFVIDIPAYHRILVDPIPAARVLEEIVTIKPYVNKRSEHFPTNLPIERKPISLLLFSERQLEHLKAILAEKFNIHKRKIKISCIYNKLNVRNIQTFKFDNNSKNVYFSFKPKKQLVEDNNLSYLVIGKRTDNNATLSTMVSYHEFQQI
jgi:hypothetical protein